MKYLCLFVCLLFQNIVWAQEYKIHRITLNTENAKKIIEKVSDKYYIESIEDNRLNKDNIGVIKKGIFNGKRPEVRFEDDSTTHYVHQFLNHFLIKNENKTPLYMGLNFLEVGELLSNVYGQEGYALLDVDFYKKEKNGNKTLVAHYHGKSAEKWGGDVTRSHSSRLYSLFNKAIKRLDSIGIVKTNNQKANFADTTYVPQKGFYRSFLDYQYNTPMKKKYKYKLKYKIDNNGDTLCSINIKDPMLRTNIFGYSDGNNFYVFSYVDIAASIFRAAKPRGRYLFMQNVIVDLVGEELGEKLIKRILLGVTFGLSGLTTSIVTSNQKRADVVFDLLTGRVIRSRSEIFPYFLRNEDEAIYNRYQNSQMNETDDMEAVRQINALYHNKKLLR